MLVLALDTSTDAVVVGLVEISPVVTSLVETSLVETSLVETAADDPVTVLAEEVCPGARRHSEQLMPALLDVCARAGRRPAEVDAVVCGVGPGPFTGLRVGIASAAAFADALGVPAHGVCSLDGIAAAALDGSAEGLGRPEPLLVVTDARRREVYWAAYRAGRRTHGPGVDTPAALAERLPELGVGRVGGTLAEEFAGAYGLAVHPACRPTAAGLVTAAAGALSAGVLSAGAMSAAMPEGPAPLEPMYLRRPDAVPPGARKRVTAG